MSVNGAHTAALFELHLNLKQRQRLCGGTTPSPGEAL